MRAGLIEVAAAGVAVDAPAMFPTAVRTVGALVVSYSTVADGWPGGCIGVRRSIDGGRSWQEPRIIVEPAEHEDAVLGALGLSVLSNGDLLLPYNTVTWTPGVGTQGRRMGLRLLTSTDAGVSWSNPIEVDVDFFGPAVYGEILQLHDGELLWPIWGQLREGERWRSAVLSSRDMGKSWSLKSTVGFDPHARLVSEYAVTGDIGVLNAGVVDAQETSDPQFRPHDPTDGFTETSIAQLPNGRLVAVLRQQGVQGDQTLQFFVAHSIDGGISWSEYQPLGFSGMSPALAALPDGRLLLASRRAAPDGSGITPAVEVRLGDSQDLTWGDPVALQDAYGEVMTAEYQCGYPSIVPDGDGRYLVFFYSYFPGTGRYIAWNRITVDPFQQV